MVNQVLVPITLQRRRWLQCMGLAALGAPPMAWAGGTAAVLSNRSYGAHPRQVMDVYRPAGQGPVACVLFVHGGAWSMGDKRSAADTAAAFTRAGYACAALNYRLHPEVSPQEQARDVAQAMALLQRDGASWGIDPRRLALMGHSAGAHLAALVALDPAYLRDANVPDSALKAVVLLDGAGYDIPRQIAEGENGNLYLKVFGRDLAVQRALSPITHAGLPGRGGAAFQIHHVARRQSSRQQAQALAGRLQAAGRQAEVHAAQGESHASINRGFGEPGDATTRKTLGFLQRHGFG